MPTKTYKARLRLSEGKSTIKRSTTSIFPGESFRDSVPVSKSPEINNPSMLNNGWDIEQTFQQNSSSVMFNNITKVRNSRRIIPNLDGPVIVASNEVRVNSEDFVKYISTAPVMGVRSAGSGARARSFIFKREDGKISIEKEFQYTHLGTIKDKLLNNQFTELEHDDQNFFVFQEDAPTPVSHFRNSSLSLHINEYLSTSFDYNTLLNEHSITEDNFFEMCDYISLESTNVKEWVFEEFGMTISSKYFPIYSHVTIVANYIDGATGDVTTLQIGNSFFDGIDAISGTIVLSTDFMKRVDVSGLTLDGFYLFYGVCPAIYIAPSDPVLSIDRILDEETDLSYIGINDHDRSGNLTISEPLIHIKNSSISESALTDVLAPLKYKKIFFEPSSNIVINHKFVRSGEKYWIDNERINKMEFEAPNHVLDMLEQAAFIGDSIITQSPIVVSDVAAIYGIFKYNETLRASLASTVVFDTTVIQNAISNAQGYGEGPFGAGGFGQGELQTHGSTIYYSTPAQPISPSQNNIAIQVKPVEIGYEVILPAWAVESSIQVTELTTTVARPFEHWSFVQPDIVVFDKEKVNRETTYIISFDMPVHPVITNINFQTGTIDITSTHDPSSIYPAFQGFYVLHSKEITIRMGYVDDAGIRNYFPKTITVNMVLEKEYLQRIVTGMKTILL